MTTGIKINCIIGIDPGAAGGIAVYIPGELIKVVKNPKDVTDLRDFLTYYADNYTAVVFLEKLSVRPDDVTAMGGKPNMGKLYRIQKMMANYEHLKAIIETAGIPYIMVHPMTWQTKLKLRERGIKEEKAERKHRYAVMAGKLFPGCKITLWNADALLIMQFGRWALENDMKWITANLPAREHNKLF